MSYVVLHIILKVIVHSIMTMPVCAVVKMIHIVSRTIIGHQTNNWCCQRNLTGHIACITSVISSTAFIASKEF